MRGLLEPVPRACGWRRRPTDELILTLRDSVDWHHLHTVQFCDNYAYEYAWLKGDFEETHAAAGDGLYETEQRAGADKN